MMKKLIATLSVLVIFFIGCSDDNDSSTKTNSNVKTELEFTQNSALRADADDIVILNIEPITETNVTNDLSSIGTDCVTYNFDKKIKLQLSLAENTCADSMVLTETATGEIITTDDDDVIGDNNIVTLKANTNYTLCIHSEMDSNATRTIFVKLQSSQNVSNADQRNLMKLQYNKNDSNATQLNLMKLAYNQDAVNYFVAEYFCQGCDLSYVDLSGFNLYDASLEYANLEYANLSNINSYGLHLDYANLNNADLSNADLYHASLCITSLCGANLSNAYLKSADLSGADLYEANLSNANLEYANLQCSSNTFVFPNGDRRYCDLGGSDLSNANLSNADLHNTLLFEANLSDANLSNANLSNASLYGANLSNAYLKNADLSGADLYKTNLSEANLSYANLRNIKNLYPHELSNVADLSYAIWKDGRMCQDGSYYECILGDSIFYTTSDGSSGSYNLDTGDVVLFVTTVLYGTVDTTVFYGTVDVPGGAFSSISWDNGTVWTRNEASESIAGTWYYGEESFTISIDE